uniref:Macaca fascicularis brain cDNA clone: QflA-16432, similar to human protein tyrosine phosphatase, receptor type, A (PTPRA),transcript variant 1, mRNA, RefSeq: NM_002836.2 n=1 Tax=Macaca fascicularis TaxID=9541 RepID=I7GBD1_MACFA|nr:unnamed protein product [Macaca fascicularis]
MKRGFQITSSRMPEQNPGRGIPALQQPLQKLSLLQVILTRRTEEMRHQLLR